MKLCCCANSCSVMRACCTAALPAVTGRGTAARDDAGWTGHQQSMTATHAKLLRIHHSQEEVTRNDCAHVQIFTAGGVPVQWDEQAISDTVDPRTNSFITRENLDSVLV